MRRLTSPVVQLVALYVLALGAATFGAEPGGLAAMALMTLFAVANPLVAGLGTGWWATTFISATGFGLLFALVGTTPAVKAMREGATVFLFPAMVYMAAAPLSGLVRLWRWWAARARAGSGA
ncbi:MAG: hypothetical protein AB7O28_02750 [Vicinamibacterales bacterium]